MSNGLEVLKLKSGSISAIRYLMKHSGVTVDMLVADHFLSEWAASLTGDSNVTVSDNTCREMAMESVTSEDFSVWMEDLHDLTAKFLFSDAE